MVAGKKLNLKWVTEAIGDSYKKWKLGDVITIQAQTGTGKTWWVKNVLVDYTEDWEQILLVCNRTNLKRQLKIDLLKKFGNDIPRIKDDKGEPTDKVDMDLIDKITQIHNITITSYQAIHESLLDSQYGLSIPVDISEYTYIILDESHMMFTDAAFNNRCRLAVKALIETHESSAIKIFISATMEEIEKPIEDTIKRDRLFDAVKHNLIKYTTGIDYSYVKPMYFNGIENIINTIKNDKTEEKWLIFISNKTEGDNIKKELGEDMCETIYSGDRNEELDSIILNSKFNKKVLVATKCLDNGVNFSDELLTNIVIMTWDRTSFIQMLGRKRVDIDNAQELNLYIPKRYKKSFSCKINNCEALARELELFLNDENSFNRKYDNDLKLLGDLQHLFYRNKDSGKYNINPIGKKRLEIDKKFFEEMVEEFKVYKEYTFILKQLDWLNLIDTFDFENDIGEVKDNSNSEALERYLKSIVGAVIPEVKDRQELIEKINLIDTNHSNIKENNIKLLKNISTLNAYLNEIGSNFTIKEFETSKIISEKKKKYKHAWKVVRLSDT